MKKLTVIVPTMNEELHLERCLTSLSGLECELYVVDSRSSDRTQEIAAAHNAEVVLGDWSSFAEKMNWCLENLPIVTTWVMRLDADEYISTALIDEINKRLTNISTDISAFEIKRRVHFMGKWIRHGGRYPSWQTRLWRHGKARFESRELDEHMLVDGGVAQLEHDFVDDNLRGIADWITKHNIYSNREVVEQLKAQLNDEIQLRGQAAFIKFLKVKVYGRFPLFVRPLLYWFWRYFVRLGFLDGKEGLIYHFLHGFWYRFLIDVKLIEARKQR